VNDSKRSLQVNVRLSPDNLKVMRQAADHIWPGVPLSNSTLLLTLASHKALEILNGKALSRKSRAWRSSKKAL
jgi:hypothetical protein